jgi:hypothetical protein
MTVVGFSLALRGYPQLGSPTSIFGVMHLDTLIAVTDLAQADLASTIHSSVYIGLLVSAKGTARFNSFALLLDFVDVGSSMLLRVRTYLEISPFFLQHAVAGSLLPSRGLGQLGFVLLVGGVTQLDLILVVSDFLHLDAALLSQVFSRMGATFFAFSATYISLLLSLRRFTRSDLFMLMLEHAVCESTPFLKGFA